MPGALVRKPFLIQCPGGLLETYNVPAYLVQGTYLRLLVEPNDYSVTNEQEGETKYVPGFSTQRLQVALMRRSCRIKVKDDTAVIRSVIEELAAISQSTAYTGAHVPLTALDYARPEFLDVKAAGGGGNPFTTRIGIIPPASIESGGVWEWRGESRHSEGFTFSFVELTLR